MASVSVKPPIPNICYRDFFLVFSTQNSSIYFIKLLSDQIYHIHDSQYICQFFNDNNISLKNYFVSLENVKTPDDIHISGVFRFRLLH